MNSRDGLNKDSGSARGARDCRSLQIKYLASTGHPSKGKKGEVKCQQKLEKRSPGIINTKKQTLPAGYVHLTSHNSSVFVETRARAEFSDGHGARQPTPPPPSFTPPPRATPRPGAASPPTNGIHGSQVSVPPPAQPSHPSLPVCPVPVGPPLLNHRQSDLPCPASLFYQFAPFFRACRLPIQLVAPSLC